MSQSPVVLFVTNTVTYGGAEKHLVELINRLRPSGVRSVIACLKEDPFSERLQPDHAQVITNQSTGGFSSWLSLFRRVRPESVVFIPGVSNFPWYAYLAAKCAGVAQTHCIQHNTQNPLPPPPSLTSINGILRRCFGWRTRYVLDTGIMTRIANYTICVSEAVRRSLVLGHGYPAAKTITILNGVNISEFGPCEMARTAMRERMGFTPEDVVLVCVARLTPEKGVDILLDAIAKLVRENCACKCVVVGDGPLKQQLTDKVLSLGLQSHVFLEGFQKDVKPYLQAADIFTLTSYNEGLPFAVLEAMACGLPCVVTNVGGNAEAVTVQEGFVVPPGSADQVAQAISSLLKDRQQRMNMSRSSRTRVEDVFNLDLRMKDLGEAILKPAASSSSAAH